MADFKYQKPFPILKDDTEYRLITKDYVSTKNSESRAQSAGSTRERSFYRCFFFPAGSSS